MKRVSLFLTEKQIKKAKEIAKASGSPWTAVVRHALDFYLHALKQTRIKPHLRDGRVKL